MPHEAPRPKAQQQAMQCAACGAALPPGETMSCAQCGATLAIPSLREAYAAVEKLAPVLKANAEKPPPEVVKRRLERDPGRPAAAARVGRRHGGGGAAAPRPRRSRSSGRRWVERGPQSGARGGDRRRRSGWCGGSGAEPRRAAVSATLLALGAIALWATLASLGVALGHVPPFLLTGLALVIGSVPGLAAGAAVAGAGVDPGARHLRPVRLPLPAVRRPAQRPAGRGQPRQLPLAAPHRRARAAVPAGDEAAAGACRRGARRLRRRGARDPRRARPHRRLRLGLPAGPRLGLHLGQLFAADAPRRPLPDGGRRPVRAGVGRAGAALPPRVRAAGRRCRCATGG